MTDPIPTQPPAERIFNSNYIKLWFGLFFFMLNMSTFNLLPYYLELRGASPNFYGAVAGSMGASSFAVLVLLGSRADMWSRKITVGVYFISALLGNLLAIWAMGQADLRWFYLPRLLQGVFMGVGFPIIFSWAVEVTPPAMKHLVLAWFGIGGILANSLGPTLGEVLLSIQGDPNDPGGYLAVFLAATISQLLSLAFFLSTTNSRGPAHGNEKGGGGLWPLMRRRESVLVLMVALSFGGMFGVMMSFGKNFTASLGLEYVSVLLWAYSIGAISSRVFIRQIMYLVPQKHMIPVGLTGLGGAFLIMGWVSGYAGLGGAGLLYGLSHGILFPTLYVQFLNFQEPGEIGRAATLFQGFFSVGWGLMPMVGGVLIHFANFPTLFSLLTVLAGLGIVLHLHAEWAAKERNEGA